MRDHRRGMRSAPTDVPFGITVVQNGQTHHLSLSHVPDTPLRQELRDAALKRFSDHGGKAKAVSTAREIVKCAARAHKALEGLSGDRPLSVRHLDPADIHRVLFRGRTDPASVRTTYARALLLGAAEAANAKRQQQYLEHLKLYGRSKPSAPYSSTELVTVLDWCKTRLNDLYLRRRNALAEIGVDAEASDAEMLAVAKAALASGDLQPRHYRWWVAQIYVHGPDQPQVGRTKFEPEARRALRDLIPGTMDAVAAALLFINEYGAEGSLLVSMDTRDVRRDANNSSVMVIEGIKTRADKAVSRKGNTLSTWSGGRVLQRWIEITAPARRFTGTDHVWLWQQSEMSDKTVRWPYATFIPARPIILEGGAAVITGPSNQPLRLSTRRMRKTWQTRGDKAFGAGFAGPLDPNHEASTAWAFYRSVGLTREERMTVLSEAQDDYLASAQAKGIVIPDGASRDDAKALLVSSGMDEAVAERVLRGKGSDSGTTVCKNPQAAPEQPEGTLCRQTPFACLLCPNAIHTVAHLPVILALDEHIDRERHTLPAEEFVAQWAGVDVGVQRVIDSFSRPAVEDARRDVEQARKRIKALTEAYQ